MIHSFQQAHNLSFPDWATSDVFARMIQICDERRSFEYGDPDLTYLDTGGGQITAVLLFALVKILIFGLFSGPLLGLMMNELQLRVENSSTLKLIYYSAVGIQLRLQIVNLRYNFDGFSTILQCFRFWPTLARKWDQTRLTHPVQLWNFIKTLIESKFLHYFFSSWPRPCLFRFTCATPC